MSRRLELILKLTERCNIACTYCYYFENEQKSALTRPPYLTDEVARQFVHRVHETIREGHHQNVRIIMHGGEPMMYGKARFAALCTDLQREFLDSVQLCMQTNAMLVDDEWVSIFERHKVAVGVSIDGPPSVHDANRVDKKGRATSNRVEAGIRRLVQAATEGRISPPGALIVVQPDTSPTDILRYVTTELSITQMDFLLPDATWDSGRDTAWLGPYLVELFKAWLAGNQEEVSVRILKSTMSLLTGGASFLGGFGPIQANALTVLSDGAINGDDFLRPCGDEFLELDTSVFSASFARACMLNRFRLETVGATQIPSACNDCPYCKTCCGGQMTHRFSRERLFDNPSVYCQGLRTFYDEVCATLLNSGVAIEQIASVLLANREDEGVDHQAREEGTLRTAREFQIHV
ncbi:radical SAM protein [Delftia acidovorans]|uniref:radical SAM protein n=1 Tax=Delftia acidovorans TaxID=80866 RepID=UPI002FDEFDFC